MDVRLYVNGRADLADPFEASLQAACGSIGVAPTIARTGAFAPSADSATVFFGNSGVPFGQAGAVAGCLAAGGHVFPVLDSGDPRVVQAQLPPSLSALNALFVDRYPGSWAEVLVDAVLGKLWFRRSSRRLFISYGRSESSAVAQQLFHALTALGYDVFLDESSIDYGDDFQASLKWRLNDTDLVLLLCSPQLAASRWVREELRFARAHHIELLALRWPGADPRTVANGLLGTLMPDQQLDLAPADLDGGGELTPSAWARVLVRVLEQRAVGVSRRRAQLVAATRRALAPRGDVQDHKEPGDLVLTVAGARTLVRTLPFRPAGETLHDVHLAASGLDGAACVYPENRPGDPRSRALRWLASGTRTSHPSTFTLWALHGRRLV